ncbi:MAG: sugar transferase [Clostridia bacterium]|nr:sugar transferase [Clostridia bacterium]
MYAKYLKRLLDIILSLLALTVLSPVMILLYILVRIKLGSPVIFRQNRVGKNEKIFTMYKFRSMTNEKDAEGNLLPDSERTTSLGRFLRSSSLDELPELINILKGDLSIVGPRPLLVEYLPYYSDYERKRHNVRGGLTQPEVLYDKVFPSWDEQLEYEAYYAENITFATDLKIIIKTIKIIFGRCSSNYGGKTRESLIAEREKVHPAEVSDLR